MLAEDGTRVTPRAQFDERSNTLTGLVAPLDHTGLPKHNYFETSNAHDMANKLKNCPLASTAYVQLAVPLAPNAAPYVLFYMGTNNCFKYPDVLKRWMHTIQLLREYGITVFGIGSDGDPRLLKSMVSITDFATAPSTDLGERFVMSLEPRVLLFQDTTHAVNRLRSKLFDRKRRLLIGSKVANVTHLDILVGKISKDKHGLTYDDLHPTDLMSFKPTEKVMSERVIKLLEEHVPDSEGTVVLLRSMSAFYRAYTDATLAPIESIFIYW